LIGRQLALIRERRPSAIALVFGERRLTYEALDDRACRLANGLAALGVERGDRVAVFLRNCNACMEILFAAAKLGAIAVPINFRLVARELRAILDACTPDVLFAGNDFQVMHDALKSSASLPAHVFVVNENVQSEAEATQDAFEAWLQAQPRHAPDVAVAPDEPFALMHTSGSTGLPKGTIFTHATALFSSMAKIIDFGLQPSDVTVVFGPLSHAGPLMDLTLPLLLLGGRVVIGRSGGFDARRLLRTVVAEQATVVPVYPTMLRQVTLVEDVEHYDLSRLRLIITGGEAVPVPVLRTLRQRMPHVGVVNNYGSTEGGPITTFLAPADSERKMGSVGCPAFGVDLRVVDDDRHPCAARQIGEILVRSPFTTPGYWNRPELTTTRLRDGWWHTGDLGWRDDEGFLWITGRREDMIKSGTEKIYPAEVEQVIARLPGVAEVAVVGVPDEEWGEAVAAFVVTASASTVDAASVIAHCRQHLASYKKPRHVLFVEALPRNATNKVAKAALRAGFTGLRQQLRPSNAG
jgi:acyl-CoA synthetase (AMP-forming)/AMP-acid ligase II